jgi:hypothetical protein
MAILPGISRANSPLAAPTTSFDYYLNLFNSATGENGISERSFRDFADRLEARRSDFKEDRTFLHYIFTKSHKEFLRNFTTQASFTEMFESGNYNCLTGTAMYALLLERFQMDYTIIETNYHIFILVTTEKGEVLLEATDPVRGFITGAREIDSKIEQYKRNELQGRSSDKKYFQYSFKLYNEVKLEQMLGLIHYNIAIQKYDGNEFQSAIAHLDQALDLYNSPRIEEFSRVITLTVAESSLSSSMKEYYIRKLHSIRKKHTMMSASAKSN